MGAFTEVAIFAACIAVVYRVFAGRREQLATDNRINNLEMTFNEFKAAAEAKFLSIEQAIEAEHQQVSEAIAELNDTVADLRASLEANGFNGDEAIALLNTIEGITAQIEGIYTPPEPEEETEEEETEEEDED